MINAFSILTFQTIVPYSYEPTHHHAREAALRPQETLECMNDMKSQRLETLDWCWCGPGRCSIMATAQECVCCWEIPYCDPLRGDSACVTLNDNFSHVALNKDILEMAAASRRISHGLPPGNPNRKTSHLRNQAYKNFAHWILRNDARKHHRIPLPSCVVNSIRSQFPSNDGIYTGYLDSVCNVIDI